MPTYEYVCRSCGHRFERFQKISDEPERECPQCGDPAAERLISAGAGLVFKGPGFYATDYRKSSGESAESAGGAEGAKKEKSEKRSGSGNDPGKEGE